MKRIFVVLAAAAALVGCTTKKCEIVGAIDNLNEVGYVYLTDEFSSRSVIDSAKLEGGNRFHFEKVNHAPTLAQLILKSGRPISHLFIESGKVRVAGNYETGEIKATGTPANDAFDAMMTRSQQYMADYREANGAGDKAKAAEIEAAFDAMQTEYWEQNKDNIFGIFMLRQLVNSLTGAEMLERLSALPEELKELRVVQRLQERAERKQKVEPQAEGSDYVPYYIDVVQTNVDGVEVSLKSVVEDKKNLYVLLDFWASWCRPCMGEVPTLLEAYKLYHDKGFEIYGVSLDTNHETWKNTIEKQGMKWVNVSELKRFDTKPVEDYAVGAIPCNFLIDCSTGVIVANNLYGEKVLEKLAELFK